VPARVTLVLAVMTADTKKWSEVIAATGAKVPQ
jgi:hypothetical protein